MPKAYGYVVPALWLGWAAYWWVSSRNVKPVQRRESLSSRLSYVAPMCLMALLLLAPGLPVPALNERFIAQSEWSFAVAAALTAAGLLFAVWARRYLGPNWSGTITIKQDHQLVTTGPYAAVRHPIYAGILLALAGSAIAIGEWRGIVALAIALAAFFRKLRLEERWMQEQFGDAYHAYCRRVAALIPFVL